MEQLNRGFLPPIDPLIKLPKEYHLWEEIGASLPKLLLSGKIRKILKEMPMLIPGVDGPELDGNQNEMAMLLLSFMGHAFIWPTFNEPVVNFIPKSIAMPWYQISQNIGRPPVLSYASYALYNWERIDTQKPVEFGNIAVLQNFLGGLDENWFIIIHVAIEAKAALAINAGILASKNVAENKLKRLNGNLLDIAESLEEMYKILLCMPEGCDPYIYYNRVRPYIHGFTHYPVIYEGIYNGKPQTFFGETGAQSSIIPFIDAALGVKHDDVDDVFDRYLRKMREYMPPNHRMIIEEYEKKPSLHEYVTRHCIEFPQLKESFNKCIEWIGIFLSKHLEYAASYIQKQHQASAHNPTERGTGGTPFMTYLKKHLKRRKKYIIS